MSDETWQEIIDRLESQNQALQERAEKAERDRDVALAQEKLAWEKFDKYGWETSYGEMRTTRDAALAENQALQEELRKYQPGQGEGWPDDRHEFAGRLTALREVAEALQERIETAARYVGKMNHMLSREGWHTSQHCARCDLEPLLSPTQETDRPDIEEIGRGIARDFGKTFDVLSRHTRPTQETDPRMSERTAT